MNRNDDAASDPTLTPSQAVTDRLKDPATSATQVAGTTDGEPGQRGGPPITLSGYDIGDVIGKGGMGEVLLARDAKIGRNVAIKRMRAATPTNDAVERFLREAKIQARLDHPAIVPVHELGTDKEGRPYFTMKRLAGRTLYELIAQASQQQLLRAFVDVCLAIDFAHARGVVHRDLKPSNVMLGDYGEVYVLDWGVARVLGERDDASVDSGDITTLEGNTQVGAMLGTPGYMAPEQVRGDAEVGRPADVYALGCMLFEILAKTELHPRGNAAIASTLSAPTDSPARRRPDTAIAPELDAACTAALAADPAQRPTARELADRIQRYLDGDRDLARRRELAEQQLVLAREAAADPARRAEAMRIAGRALALDPESTAAGAIVTQLMLEPPKQMPAKLQADLDHQNSVFAMRAARTAMWSLGGYFLFLPMALWAGVRDWPLFVAIYVLVAALVLATWREAKAAKPRLIPVLLLNSVLMLLFSRIASPFVIVPGIIGAYTATLVAQPELLDRPWLVIVTGVVTFLLPLGAEALGWLDPTWEIRNGGLVVIARALEGSGPPIIALLIFANVALIVINGTFGRVLAASRRDAQQQLEIQAWHLRQLLPLETPRPQMSPPEPLCEIR